MKINTPDRTLAQRQEALAKANRYRTKRADWKKDVKHGRADPLEVLTVPPAEFESMKVFDVLLAMPAVGRVKANKTLRVARVSPSKTIGGLSERQRGELAALLRGSRHG